MHSTQFAADFTKYTSIHFMASIIPIRLS